jgi:hypothetical protein
MNDNVLAFFRANYAPGRICLIGANDAVGTVVRAGQAGLTPDKNPSKWSHTFIMGDIRDDGLNDGSIYIFESDLHVSPGELQVINGPQESRLAKWCIDSVEHACVLGIDLTSAEQRSVLRTALALAGDENMKYPVGELFGTLWASIVKRMSSPNIFDDKSAVQCATFVRVCYKSISKDPLAATPTDLSNTSPEKLYQSTFFTFRKEMQ